MLHTANIVPPLPEINAKHIYTVWAEYTIVER